MRLEIITPLGVQLVEENLDEIVVRRLEADYDRGSEVAFLPDHGPELVHTGTGAVRWTHADGTAGGAVVASGFAECAADSVTILTPSIERASDAH